MAGKGGRPRRDETITPIVLRLPPALLARVAQAHALLQRREGVRFTRTGALAHLLELGCAAIEPPLVTDQPSAALAPPREVAEGVSTDSSAAVDPRRANSAAPAASAAPAPPFDTRKHYLGGLCARGHDYMGTGYSIRLQGSGNCLQCKTLKQRERRQARRHRQPRRGS